MKTSNRWRAIETDGLPSLSEFPALNKINFQVKFVLRFGFNVFSTATGVYNEDNVFQWHIDDANLQESKPTHWFPIPVLETLTYPKGLRTLYCRNCGGTNIQCKAWVDANSNEYISDCGEDGDGWCDNCETEVSLVDISTLWDDFSAIPINNDDEIEEQFLMFEPGTSRFDVWHWFDERCPHGLAIDLMDQKPKTEMKIIELQYHGETYKCRVIPSIDGEELIIASVKLMDKIIPGATFTDKEAELLDEKIFYYVTDKELKLSDEELIEVVREANPDFFE